MFLVIKFHDFRSFYKMLCLVQAWKVEINFHDSSRLWEPCLEYSRGWQTGGRKRWLVLIPLPRSCTTRGSACQGVSVIYQLVPFPIYLHSLLQWGLEVSLLTHLVPWTVLLWSSSWRCPLQRTLRACRYGIVWPSSCHWLALLLINDWMHWRKVHLQGEGTTLWLIVEMIGQGNETTLC